MTTLNKLPLQARIDSLVGRILCLIFYPLKIVRSRRKKIKTVSIVKFSGIGDAVLTLPMIKELKGQKNVKIRVICGKENKAVFEGMNFIDEITIIDISNKNIFVNIPKYMKLMANKADYGIDTGQSTYFSTVLNFISSKRCSGFYNGRMGFFRNTIIDDKIKCNQNKHMVFNFLDLAKEIGVKYNENKINLIELRYSNKDMNKINNLLGRQEYIGICPFHELEYKKWPVQYFKEVVSFLLEKYKYKILIMGDNKQKEEANKFIRLFSKKERERVINIAGELSLKETVALTSRLKLFITNDGGPMHIAAAMNVPVISFFGYETPTRYGPFNKRSYGLYEGPKESQCYMFQYHSKELDEKNFGLEKIKPREVIEKMKKSLKA